MLIQQMPLVTKPPGEIASEWKREGEEGGKEIMKKSLEEEEDQREIHINV